MRIFYWLKSRPRNIKWWIQRANGKLPECDLWSYKLTLLDNLKQGIGYMLREDGCVDWESDRSHRRMKKDLEFIRRWLADADFYFCQNITVLAMSDEELALVSQSGGVAQLKNGCYVATEEWMDDFNKRQAKAFRLLGKHFWGLWD